MSVKGYHIDTKRFLKKTERYLFLLLLLMIAGFFTWSENVLITRAIKVVGRNAVLLGTVRLYFLIRQKGMVDTLKSKNPLSPVLYLTYLGLGFVSFLWSTNVGYSALQWFMICQSLVFAYFFMRSLCLIQLYFPDSAIRLSRLLGLSASVLAALFLIGMWTNPEVFYRLTNGGTEARLGGYLMNPNELGMLCGVGIACVVYELAFTSLRKEPLFQLPVLLYALYATGSRSSLIGVFLILFYYVLRSDQRKLKALVGVGLLVVAPLAVWAVIFKGGDSSRVEEVLSMTGRLPFWKALILEGLPREPLFGFGFMRIDYNEYFQSTHTYPGKMTHNTFIQALMNLGFVGFILVLIQVIATINAVKKEQKASKSLLIGILIPIIINSFTEFGIFGESNYGILFYQLCIFKLAFQARSYLTSAEKHALQLGQRILKPHLPA